MKKMVFAAIVILIAFGTVTINEKAVLPVCNIVEIKNSDYKIDKELEEYVIGVVAGEMSPDFPYEALKAQAVAARTYAVRGLRENPNANIKSLWQNYITKDDMKKRWGNEYEKWYNKIKQVVYETSGEIIEYNNEPILAAFYSTSCGKTEECENVWTEDLPYLTSVESEGDIYSPYYESSVNIKKSEIKNIFGSSNISIETVTPAGYVKTVKIGNKSVSAEKIRNLFSLRSTAFEIKINNDNIIFETKGYGHGVGMSQYGACYMANQGADYREILSHYYQNTIIKKI